MKIKFLKLCISEWYNFSRDKRELSVVEEFDNVDIRVMAKGDVTGQIDSVSGYTVERITARPFKKLPVRLNRLLSIFLWANYVRKYNADIISGHDHPALFIAYISNLFKSKKNKAKLVYDCHEYAIGECGDSKLNRFIVGKLEKFLMKRCVLSIMVNEEIAKVVQDKHNQSEPSLAIRNIPNNWKLNNDEIMMKRKYFTEKLNVPEDTFIIMYHGAIYEHRGIESMLYAIAEIPDVVGVILGSSGQDEYKSRIRELCKELSIRERVIFEESVDISVLYKFVGAASLGIVIPPLKSENHLLALPNKFFENIQSMTPVIGSNFPVIGKIVDEYKIGIVVDPDNIREVVAAIKKMKEDRKYYVECIENLKIAKEQLCWENEKKKLYNAYNEIITSLSISYKKGKNE